MTTVDPHEPVHGRATCIRAPTWLATYQGLTWWDNETDGDKMYPAGRPQAVEQAAGRDSSSVTLKAALFAGCGRIRDFLQKTGSPEFNSQLKQTQFADFHGHGWLFRAVFKRDRKGNLLDAQGAR